MNRHELNRNLAIEVNCFSPSSIIEINKFNPQPGEKYIIQYVATCPFSHIDYVSDEIYAEVISLTIKSSHFAFCFYFTSDYGIDKFICPENTKIIRKRNK